ncbi:hypothetical protein EB74_31565 [Mycobacterium sp. SWH-M5]|nr:hypothetical protein EB74_31565 [Mycobacterium sp. SWH-M5]PJK19058.1 hypothetical protein CSX11_28035 [Mycolicibacterium goodii]
MEDGTSCSDEEQVRAAALHAARRIASNRITDRLTAAGMTLPGNAEDITAVLLAADPTDPQWGALSAYRLDWSLDVLTLIANALVERRRQRIRTPDVDAVAAALDAGATWKQIGEAVGSTPAVAHGRYRQRL